MAGGAGTLTIGDGGTVGSVASGPTLSLFAGGTVNVDGGALNAASLVAAGGSFNFTRGVVNLTSSR